MPAPIPKRVSPQLQPWRTNFVLEISNIHPMYQKLLERGRQGVGATHPIIKVDFGDSIIQQFWVRDIDGPFFDSHLGQEGQYYVKATCVAAKVGETNGPV